MATEPRVLTEDVRAILRRAVFPDDPDYGDSVRELAERAETSTRTVYRVMSGKKHSIDLGLADRLVLAAGGHLVDCRLVWPDGRVTRYTD